MNEQGEMEIKECDSIVAIEILQNTYHINAYNWTQEEINNMIELLKVASTNRDIKSAEQAV